jgi:hypothetical protein
MPLLPPVTSATLPFISGYSGVSTTRASFNRWHRQIHRAPD